jgi:PAS domain S-box-containing protein
LTLAGDEKMIEDRPSQPQPASPLPLEYYRFIIDAFPFPSWFKDEKGRYLFVNQAFLRFFDVSPEVVLLRKDTEIFPPELASDYANKDRTAIQGIKELQVTEIVERASRERLRVETIRVPIIDAEGAAVGITGVMRPLGAVPGRTARVDGIASSGGSLNKEERSARKPTAGIFRAGPKGAIVSAASSTARILGFDSTAELLASLDKSGGWAYVEPADGERLIQMARLTGIVDGFETRLCGKDGQVVKVLLSLESVVNDVDEHIGFDGVLQDVTEISRAEEVLLQAEEKYRNIFENAIEGIFQARADGHIISANPAFARILGYSSADDLAENVIDMGSQVYSSDKRYGEYLNLMETDGVIRDFEAQVRCKDGTIQWVSINARTVADGDGHLLYYEGTVESVTERKKLEAELRHAQKMESIGTLAGGVAHDFNNILTTIMGYCSLMMMKGGKGNPVLGYVDQIMEAANRASTLTQSLLSFSRKQATETKTVDINETIRSVEKLLRRIIGEDIELQTILCPDKLLATVGDGQVGQLLMNLATNARDAMPEGGVLTIRTELVHLEGETTKSRDERRGVFAAIEMFDTGKGMDERTKDKVFDPFFTTKEVGKGTGLGLSIVYGIVKQNKGFVNVTSEPGKGTSFTIYLPLAEASAQTGSIREKADLQGGQETVLVAEDNIQVREIVTTTLRDFGYTVIEAFDGADAMEKFVDHRADIDILLFDVIMPRKNGKEAYLEIKKLKPDVRAIFMSGYTGDVLSRKGISRVGVPMIYKPIVIEKLLKEIREVLDRSPSQLTLFP